MSYKERETLYNTSRHAQRVLCEYIYMHFWKFQKKMKIWKSRNFWDFVQKYIFSFFFFFFINKNIFDRYFDNLIFDNSLMLKRFLWCCHFLDPRSVIKSSYFRICAFLTNTHATTTTPSIWLHIFPHTNINKWNYQLYFSQNKKFQYSIFYTIYYLYIVTSLHHNLIILQRLKLVLINFVSNSNQMLWTYIEIYKHILHEQTTSITLISTTSANYQTKTHDPTFRIPYTNYHHKKYINNF